MPYSFEQFFGRVVKGTGRFLLLGKPKYEVTATYKGQWEEGRKRLLLEEQLDFSNGHSQGRVWRFMKNGLYHWQGFCPGEASDEAKGEVKENVLTFRFGFMFPLHGHLRVPVQCKAQITGQTPQKAALQADLSLMGFTFARLMLDLKTA